MQGKYRTRDLSADDRPFRAPLVPVIQLQALHKQEAICSPTFGSVLIQSSSIRPKHVGVSRTRSNSQRRSRQPRPEATQSRDYFYSRSTGNPTWCMLGRSPVLELLIGISPLPGLQRLPSPQRTTFDFYTQNCDFQMASCTAHLEYECTPADSLEAQLTVRLES